jgi:CTP:molybdopterin cytidylyltransferase MocA
VILNRERYQEEMENLTGDIGCKPILDRYPEDILEVEVKTEGIIADIDSWEEYITTGIPAGKGFTGNDTK